MPKWNDERLQKRVEKTEEMLKKVSEKGSTAEKREAAKLWKRALRKQKLTKVVREQHAKRQAKKVEAPAS